MGCGCAITRSSGFANSAPGPAFHHNFVVHEPEGGSWSGSAPSSQKAAKSFPDVVFPSPSGSGRAGLTFIQEEDGTERQVLFLDIVLIGPHASVVAEGACSGADAAGGAGSRRPSFVAGARRPSAFSDALLGRQHGKATDDNAAAALAAILGGASLHPALIPERDRALNNGSNLDLEASGCTSITLEKPPSPLPFQREGSGDKAEDSSRRPSNSSRLSAEPLEAKAQQRRLSRTSAERQYQSTGGPQFSCHCQVRGFKATVHLWPVESLSQQVPNFPISQLASTGYVALLPMESSTLSEECSTLRQRFDEVRYHAARAAASASVDPTRKLGANLGPRLGRVDLYNTEARNFNAVETPTPTTADPGESAEAVVTAVSSNSLTDSNQHVCSVTGSTDHIGMADLCDAASLFQTIVVNTAEWLLNCGAVGHKGPGSQSSLELETKDAG